MPKSTEKVDTERLRGVWDLYPPDLEKVKDATVRYEVMRGCIFRCPFCSWNPEEMRGFYYKDTERVIEELNRLPDDITLEFIDACSNTPTHLHVLKNIKKTFRQIDLLILQELYPKITDDFIDVMKEFPSVSFGIGVQSFDEKVLKAIKRRNNWELLKKWSGAFSSQGSSIKDRKAGQSYSDTRLCLRRPRRLWANVCLRA